jgi:hypothetical protein
MGPVTLQRIRRRVVGNDQGIDQEPEEIVLPDERCAPMKADS